MSKFHPCSKEFQEEAKRLGLTGNQLIQKYIAEEKLPNPIDISRENNKRTAERAGFKTYNEYERNRCHKDMEHKRELIREWRYKNGIHLPMSENEQCSNYIGIWIGERTYGRKILPEIFGSIEQEMPFGNSGYDFIVKGNIKVDIKSSCLREDSHGWKGWEPHVRSNIADYFTILAFDNITDLNIKHVWVIGRCEKIRGCEFYKRDSIKITNKYRYLLEFKRFDWIDKLNGIQISKDG